MDLFGRGGGAGEEEVESGLGNLFPGVHNIAGLGGGEWEGVWAERRANVPVYMRDTLVSCRLYTTWSRQATNAKAVSNFINS